MASKTIDVDIDLDDFSDEDDELKSRKREALSFEVEKELRDVRDLAADVQSWLMVKRRDRARAAMDALFASVLPAHVIAADEALREGRASDAICELEHLISPSPATTATSLELVLGRRVSTPN